MKYIMVPLQDETLVTQLPKNEISLGKFHMSEFHLQRIGLKKPLPFPWL